VPGDLYVIEAIAAGHYWGIGSDGVWNDMYPYGHQILRGAPSSNNDLWFREGAFTRTVLSLDIKPRSCPNPLNLMLFDNPPDNARPHKGGVLPVAVLGRPDFDVDDIDVSTVLLEGVAPIRHNYEDVAAPVVDGEACECTSAGSDGYVDLTLKFDKADIAAAIGSAADGDVIPLTVTALLNDGTPVDGTDCVVIHGKEEALPEPSKASCVTLNPAVPNPCNPTTRISYVLPTDDFVKLSVYNVAGEQVDRLVWELQSAGEHAVEWSPRGLPSGIYFYRIEVGDFAESRKLVLIK